MPSTSRHGLQVLFKNSFRETYLPIPNVEKFWIIIKPEKDFFSMKARRNNRFELKRKLMADAIKLFETAIDLDPHDDLAHMYCALEYANC